MSAFTCPVCAGELRETARLGVAIDTCTRCRGVWLDRGELEKLAAAMGAGDEPRKGFLQGALDTLNDRTDRRRYEDDDDAYRRHDRKPYKKRRSLLDFFD